MDLTSISFGLLALAMLAIAMGSVFKGLTGVGLPILAVPMMASFSSVEQYFSRRSGIHIFRVPRWLTGILGTSAGTIQGATGISAPIVGPYYHAAGLTRESYAFAAAFTFLVFSIAQLTSMIRVDLMTTDRLVIGLAAVVPTLLFTQLGIRYSGKISDQTFNRILVVLFVLMELKLVLDIL